MAINRPFTGVTVQTPGLYGPPREYVVQLRLIAFLLRLEVHKQPLRTYWDPVTGREFSR